MGLYRQAVARTASIPERNDLLMNAATLEEPAGH